VTERALTLARAGDQDAFRELTEPYRHELQLDCYRIVGSTQDAEDLVQEALLAAWRGLDEFTERASIRTWLYRIATNRSVDALRANARRPQQVGPMTELPEPGERADLARALPRCTARRDHRPISRARGPLRDQRDDRARFRRRAPAPPVPTARGARPARRTQLPGDRGGRHARHQRSVGKQLLRRARAAFETRLPAAGRDRTPLPNSRREREIIGRFADAVETGDIDSVVALLTDDAWLRMPPQPYEYHGAAAIGHFLQDRAVRRGAPLRLIPTRANGQPAFGCYFPSPHTDIARPYGLLVVTLAGNGIAEITWFADSSVFPHFGLPRTLPSRRT
jgi:RNA polymerase sigma-70 factor, ECF subfamily